MIGCDARIKLTDKKSKLEKGSFHDEISPRITHPFCGSACFMYFSEIPDEEKAFTGNE